MLTRAMLAPWVIAMCVCVCVCVCVYPGLPLYLPEGEFLDRVPWLAQVPLMDKKVIGSVSGNFHS